MDAFAKTPIQKNDISQAVMADAIHLVTTRYPHFRIVDSIGFLLSGEWCLIFTIENDHTETHESLLVYTFQNEYHIF